jgi:hypothetical protein
MNDESVVPKDSGSLSRDRENLLYDYSKHLLSLALIGIGGIITIAQTELGKQIPGKQVGAVIVLLAVCAVCSLLCSATVLESRIKEKPLPKSAHWAYQGSMAFLGAGFGTFLMNWLDLLF